MAAHVRSAQDHVFDLASVRQGVQAFAKFLVAGHSN
jgi:hypothetical protein